MQKQMAMYHKIAKQLGGQIVLTKSKTYCLKMVVMQKSHITGKNTSYVSLYFALPNPKKQKNNIPPNKSGYVPPHSIFCYVMRVNMHTNWLPSIDDKQNYPIL